MGTVSNKDWNQAEQERARLQAEVQSSVIEPMSMEVFAKTPEEKEELKVAKARYKSNR